tara:strand:- start:630 stop:1355 length:726 start_codon:yes stop_codon:yes gene_type:complete
MNFSNTYKLKISALKECISILNINIDEIFSSYENIFFKESNINKKALFKNIIVGKTFSDNEQKFMQSRCGNLTRFRDKRTGIEYATDLILGWISEDAILHYFKSKKVNISKFGSDSDREFLDSKSISAQSDLILSKSNNEKMYKVEYMNDWTGFWKKSNKLHLRENKYLKIKKENAIFLGVSPLHREGIAFHTSDKNAKWKYIPSHYPYGGKPAWELSNVKDFLTPLNVALDKIILLISAR